MHVAEVPWGAGCRCREGAGAVRVQGVGCRCSEGAGCRCRERARSHLPHSSQEGISPSSVMSLPRKLRPYSGQAQVVEDMEARVVEETLDEAKGEPEARGEPEAKAREVDKSTIDMTILGKGC